MAGVAPVVTMFGADDGVYINTSGGNETFQYCTTSKYIKINAGQKLIAYTVCHTDSLAIALYNDSKTFLSGVRGVNMNGIRKYEATATVNGYFRFATNSQYIDFAKSASICYVVG